jgi:hypothetical protein
MRFLPSFSPGSECEFPGALNHGNARALGPGGLSKDCHQFVNLWSAGLRLMEGADICQIAKNCRTGVEMIEKYYASPIKTSLDALAGTSALA